MSARAAVDCGTNSIRLLVVGEGDRGGVELERRTHVVRLGEGVDATGRLSPAALERARVRLVEFARRCEELEVDEVALAATSATRNAENAADFVAVVRDTLGRWGVEPAVLTGEQEARLTFLGAAGAVRSAGHPGPYLVVDIGGGSTELVRGGGDVEAAVSIDLGAVRVHERLALSVPPTPQQQEAVAQLVRPALDAALARVPLDGVHTLVGVAGTSTTVAAHELGLTEYDTTRVHLAQSTPASAARVARSIVAMGADERSRVPGVVPGRADVIGAGALIWAHVLERAADAGVRRVVVSEHDLLDGLLLR